jgi:dTDP-4-dehydrorhamnose 3,5-epimerase-like enzyme/dTDP-4-dehydrorhamnose reductase
MFTDERGTLIFPIKNNNFNTKETTVSINNKNVFRGIHVEQFSKLVTCIKGSILDIIIDFNIDSSDYLIPKYYILDSNTFENQIIVKPNFGHAFLSLDDSIVLYHFSEVYNKDTTVTYNYKDPIFNIKLSISEPIISQNDLYAPFYKKIDFYIFGSSGFIGSIITNTIIELNKNIYKTKLRLENIEKIENELLVYKPKYVICSAGLTGTPNISWCETYRTETIETNITYQMTLAHICKKHNIHLTIIGSGVIFNNDKFYTENDEGNFDKNFYGKCRISLENMVRNYNNILYVRINYPISKNYSNKNLITKLLSYSNIDNVKITLTYLDELIPYLIDLINNNEYGICNLVNEGVISLEEIIDIYCKSKNVCNTKIITTNNINKSTSLLEIGKLKKYNVMNVKNAVYACIQNYHDNTIQ